MANFFIIVWKEFIHIRRDRRTVIMVLAVPLLMILLYGYAISFDLKNIPTGVVDLDRSSHTMELLTSITSSGYFTIVPYPSIKKLYSALQTGNVKCGLVIPPDYSKDIIRKPITKIQVIIDGSDANLTRNIIRIIQKFFSRGYLNTRFLYNPNLTSRNFFVPGLIVVLMTMLGVIITSHSIVKEKEQGNFELLSTTPLKGKVIILGKLMPYGIIALLDVFVITGFSILIFRIPFRGSVLFLLFYSIIFLFPTLAIGIMISAFAQTELTAVTTSFVAAMLPSIILSGFVFPVANMPYWLQWVAKIIPATHFLRIVRGIFLKGVNIFPMETIMLLGLGIFFLLIASRGIKKRVK